MKILIVSNSLPYPPHDGETLRLFNLLKHLSDEHEISMLTFLDHPDSAKYKEQVNPYCANLSTLLTKQNYTIFNKFIYHLSLYPYSVVKKYSKLMKELVKATIEKNNYNIIHFDGIGMLPYGLSIQAIPKIAFAADAVSLYFLRNIAIEKRLYKKFLYLIEFIKMKQYEKNLYQMFQRCVIVSETDKTALQQHCPNAKLSVVPNGVDTDYFNPTHIGEDFPSILFSGNMDYPPNVRAVLWFVQKVLPLLKKDIPDVKFYIVGRNPSRELDHLRNDKQIIITGFVDDIRPYLDRATVFVCPMISGAGIKNKLLEAMSMEKAIIASSLSLQGIPGVKYNQCILMADKPMEFYEGIVSLLRNPGSRHELGITARKFVMDNYSWEHSAKLLENIYTEAICDFRNRH